MEDDGIVYVIRCAPTSYYKIGVSGSPEDRLYMMQGGCPLDLILIAVKRYKDPYRKESQLHKAFADKRIRGEWYELNRQDLKRLWKLLE